MQITYGAGFQMKAPLDCAQIDRPRRLYVSQYKNVIL